MVSRRRIDRRVDRSGGPTALFLPLLTCLLLAVLAAPVRAEETAPDPALPDAGKEISDGGTGEPDDGMDAAEDTAPEPEAPVAEGDASQGGLDLEIGGYVRGKLEARWADSDSDLDLRTDVLLDAIHRGEDMSIRARLNGSAHWDVSGDQDRGDVLYDYWDTFDSELRARLYELFVEADGLLDGAVKLRLGRQFFQEAVPLHFDGLRADVDLGEAVEGLDLSVLGGLIVYHDERSRNGDWLAGLAARYRAGKATTIRFEYYHVAEEFDGINDTVVDPALQTYRLDDENLDDDYFGLSVWHAIDRRFRLYGRSTLLNGDFNELQLRGRYTSEDGVWGATLEFYEMFERLRNVTNDLSPYVPLLGTYEPFWRLGGRVEFRPDDAWLFQAGYTRRELEDDDDEGPFNHTFDHYFATATAFGLVRPGLDLSLIMNGYESDRNDTFALGGSADYEATKELTVSAGVDYALFKYDFLQDTEREDVWSYWLDARWRVAEKTDLRGRLSLTDDDFETYVTLEVSVTVRF
jgi:hypothetical protein